MNISIIDRNKYLLMYKRHTEPGGGGLHKHTIVKKLNGKNMN